MSDCPVMTSKSPTIHRFLRPCRVTTTALTLCFLVCVVPGCRDSEVSLSTSPGPDASPAADSTAVPTDPQAPAQAQPLSIDPIRQKIVDQRQMLLKADRSIRFPSPLKTTPEEEAAARRFSRLQASEIDGYRQKDDFPPMIAFHQAKPIIEKSEIFRIIRRMPKGGALHIHSTAGGRAEWLVQECLRREDCHICWPEDIYANRSLQHVVGEIRFGQPGTAPAGFLPIHEVLTSTPDLPGKLLQLLTIGPEDKRSRDRWSEFNDCFRRLGSILSNDQAYREYFEDAFRTLANDGVMYAELRTGFPILYSNDGQPFPRERAISNYIQAMNSVREEFPEFDIRLIASDWRGANIEAMVNNFRNAIDVMKKFPDLFVGYDLVGQETDNSPTSQLINIWPALMNVCQEEDYPFPTLLLHDGESDWADNENLIDAHVLGTRRIGHGINLYLFPSLEQEFRSGPTALEVCPISNQTLGYVTDVRLHPANGYIRRGLTCVISYDDPCILGNDGLSYDFWTACMAWDLDLMTLRELARNSIQQSLLEEDKKMHRLDLFSADWQTFIKHINNNYPEPTLQI